MRNEALDVERYKGCTIELHHDQDAESPRENDNLGTIIAWHRRYRLSDKDAPSCEPEDFKPDDYEVCLPIYMMEHGNVALSTGDYGDRWDSGQVGYIYVTRARILEDQMVKRITAKVRANVIRVLKAEVEEYGQYINGECYGYVAKDEDGEQIDSCWGYIGSEYPIEEGKRAIDYHLEARTQKADQLVDLQRSEN